MASRPSSGKARKPLFNDQQFRILIEKSHDVIVLLDRKGKLLYATPSIERLYGRTVNEITGLSSFLYIYPTDIPRVMNAIKHLILHPDQSITLQIRVKHKDGTWKWIEAIGTNYLQEPEIGAIVVNFHDITEFKELEERKDNFISIASHELKTPMTIIKSYAELLRRRLTKNVDDQSQQILTKLEEQINRLSLLVKELLDVTALQRGTLPLRKDSFQLEHLVKEIIDQEAFAHEKTHITFKTEKLPRITADKFKLSQVIYNLISNAIKYSPKESEVNVRVFLKNDHILVGVQDQGRGIKPEDIKHIFDRFYRAEHTASASGLGLGLYISQEIIKQHGGEIRVTSEVNKGSTFTIVLPLKPKKS